MPENGREKTSRIPNMSQFLIGGKKKAISYSKAKWAQMVSTGTDPQNTYRGVWNTRKSGIIRPFVATFSHILMSSEFKEDPYKILLSNRPAFSSKDNSRCYSVYS